jgi:multimeric flavodoxin WrbA
MSNKILLGICGSPRIASTDFVIKYALKRAENIHCMETKYFSSAGKSIIFCKHCDYCIKNKKGCITKDDITELYPLMKEADAWIIGTPVYQGNVTGQIKTIIDRCRALTAINERIFQNKVGAAIAVGGDRIGGQESAIRTIIDFYIINEMIPVGGGSFGANLGGTIWSKDKMIKGAKSDKEGLKSINRVVDHISLMLSSIK